MATSESILPNPNLCGSSSVVGMARREDSRSTRPFETTATASSLLDAAVRSAAVLMVFCFPGSLTLAVAVVRRCVNEE